jgi:hypothetical protein
LCSANFILQISGKTFSRESRITDTENPQQGGGCCGSIWGATGRRIVAPTADILGGGVNVRQGDR